MWPLFHALFPPHFSLRRQWFANDGTRTGLRHHDTTEYKSESIEGSTVTATTLTRKEGFNAEQTDKKIDPRTKLMPAMSGKIKTTEFMVPRVQHQFAPIHSSFTSTFGWMARRMWDGLGCNVNVKLGHLSEKR